MIDELSRDDLLTLIADLREQLASVHADNRRLREQILAIDGISLQATGADDEAAE